MSSILSGIRGVWKLSGIRTRTVNRTLRRLPRFYADLRELRRQAETSGDAIQFGKLRPMLSDQTDPAGRTDGHYFHQDLLVARRIFETSPDRHIDIGSRLDGFVAHVASFRPVEVIDLRAVDNEIPNVTFVVADMMGDLADELVECTDSLSCLHAVEHFGLGRYGDRIDLNGHIVGLENMKRMVRPGGRFYLSTPIGAVTRIEFNAHRVFSVPCLCDLVKDEFTIESFSYVDDEDRLHTDVDVDGPAAVDSFGLSYGCGILELKKKTAEEQVQ